MYKRIQSRVWLLVAIAISCLLVVSCAGGSDNSSTGTASRPVEVSKYTQTWPKSYSATTCAEWASEMTDSQRWAAAADMLTGARNKGDGGTGVPSDALITRFTADVTEGCSTGIEAQNVAETGASIYLIGREQYRP